ncbi:MAG: NUDIX hydrolase [Pseudomonadota bacterium]
MPLSFGALDKRQARSQFAALPFRVVDGNVQIMLVTSRRTKRWIIPKGWPEDGMTPARSAAKEAWEEGGAKGRVYDLCLGVYSYAKTVGDADDLPCLALVYPFKVKKTERDYPERKQRRRKWFTQKQAANRVNEPELKRLIKTFDPAQLKGY